MDLDIKKLAPWNWFKNEEASEAKNLTVRNTTEQYHSPLISLHKEIDRMFENAFLHFGMPFLHNKTLAPQFEGAILKPKVDIAVNDKEYLVTVEVPGVEDKDVQLELMNGTLVIKGEKKLESEQNEKGFYRIERSYGSFQRVLTLPEDTDQDNIDAKFKNGVLTITLLRREVSKPKGKLIDIKKVA